MITVPVFIICLVFGAYNILFEERINKIAFGCMWFVLLLYIIAVGVLGGV